MRVVDPSLKPQPDAATPLEQERHTAASMYAALVAGLSRQAIAWHFGMSTARVTVIIGGIPPAVRAVIEKGAGNPNGTVARWRVVLAESEEFTARVLQTVINACDEALTDLVKRWTAIEQAGRKPLPLEPPSAADGTKRRLARRREMFRQRCAGVDLDEIARRAGMTRGRAVASIARLSERERNAIRREVERAAAADRGPVATE